MENCFDQNQSNAHGNVPLAQIYSAAVLAIKCKKFALIIFQPMPVLRPGIRHSQ